MHGSMNIKFPFLSFYLGKIYIADVSFLGCNFKILCKRHKPTKNFTSVHKS